MIRFIVCGVCVMFAREDCAATFQGLGVTPPSTYAISPDGNYVVAGTATFHWTEPMSWQRVTGASAISSACIERLLGDFNANGTVDAADYVVWRNRLGTTYTQADYDVWRANFGTSSISAIGKSVDRAPAVPEPSTPILVPLLLTSIAGSRRRVRNRTNDAFKGCTRPCRQYRQAYRRT